MLDHLLVKPLPGEEPDERTFKPGTPPNEGDVHVLTDRGQIAWATYYEGVWVDCVNMAPVEPYVGKVLGWREALPISQAYIDKMNEDTEKTKEEIHNLALEILGIDAKK